MNSLQEKLEKRIVAWLQSRYGNEITTNRQERAMRLVEEAIELAQAEDITIDTVTVIGERVYSRPKGAPSQEASGVMLCLVAWAAAACQDLELVSEIELDRIEQVPVEISRQRHQAKADLGTAIPVPSGDSKKKKYKVLNHVQMERFLKGFPNALPDQLFPIISHMLHNDQEIRACVALDTKGRSVYITLPIEYFNGLNEVEINQTE